MSEFLQQNDARRSRILEAALVEFADKGYKKASTNTIVKQAGVSKGLLFHYFISKKELYIYLYKHAIDTISNDLYEQVNFADKDVINRVRQSTLVKIESYANHPLFMDLFEKVSLVKEADILSAIAKLNRNIEEETYEKLFSNIDYYAFKDSLNIDRCLQVIRWTVDTISQTWSAKHNGVYDNYAFNNLKTEINQYLDLFKQTFYR